MLSCFHAALLPGPIHSVTRMGSSSKLSRHQQLGGRVVAPPQLPSRIAAAFKIQ